MRIPHSPCRATRPALAAALLVLVTLVAGCGSGSDADTSETSTDASSSAPSDAFPVTLTGANGEVTIEQAPEKIVSMGPTLTETLFAVGAGPQVAAADDNSNYPAEAPTTDLSAFQPNAEAITEYEPDLVLVNSDSNGLVDALTQLEIPTLVLEAPKDLDSAYEQMVTVGRATGHGEDAEKLAATVEERVEAAVASVPDGAKGTKVYHELDPTFYSVTSDTFLGSVYSQLGLTNIADAAQGAADAGGYPQLSAEYVVQQAPELIVLADTKCCQQSAATLAERPGFAQVPAVKNGAVLEADDDIASRWGPRVADFAESVAAELATMT